MIRSCVVSAVLLAAVPAAAQTAFPDIGSAPVTISLSRSACFGACPVYRLDIDAKGAVTFVGERYVAVPGKHRSQIEPGAVSALLNVFRAANFFSLKDAYRARVTDLPTTTITLTIGSQRKTVVDYGGMNAGMPGDVLALENTIDAAADSEKWVKGNARTVAALKAEGWDFESHREDNLKLLSAMSPDGNLVWGLLAAGMPADSDYGCTALMKAVTARDFATAFLLTAAHAPFVTETAREYRGGRCDVPGRAVDENDLEALAWLLRHGADASGRDGAGLSLLMRAKGQSEIVRLLLADGADINAKDGEGRTALLRAAAWPDVVTQLLQRGADPNVQDRAGRSAFDIFPQGSPAAQLLLDWRQAQQK